jgi:hypothetical protein
MTRLHFDVYGRFVVDLERRDGRWVATYVGEGRRRPAEDVLVPPEATEDSLADHLDVLFHEYARPGQVVRRLGQDGERRAGAL